MDRWMVVIWLLNYIIIAIVSYVFGSRNGFRQGAELSAELYKATIEFIERLKRHNDGGKPKEG